MTLKKRFNLYYLFSEEKARMKMSREKHMEIWKVLEAFFHATNHNRPTLPENNEKEERKGKHRHD